jgi:sulfhydrogenase subunit alpha
VSKHEDHFIRHQVKHSHVLHSRLRERGAYPVGPLARFDLNFARLPSLAQETAWGCEIAPPCRNQFRSIVIRAIEMILACHESLRILDANEPPTAARVLAEPLRARGCAITEAPRGIRELLPASSETTLKERRCERSIRNRDPRISCATHLLNVEVPRV